MVKGCLEWLPRLKVLVLWGRLWRHDGKERA
jgi:hypothetical protein